MKTIKVKNIRKLITKKPTVVTPKDSIHELVIALTDNPKTRSLYVVEDGKFQYTISLKDLARLAFPYLIHWETLGYSTAREFLARKADDVLTSAGVYTKDEEDMETVLTKMFNNGVEELPVLDPKMKVVGEINLLELLAVWVERSILRNVDEIE